jgi:hypothetical protein
MRFFAVLVFLASLAGCAQYDETRSANLAAAARDRAASDDAACQQSGAKPGTPAYDDCRKRYDNQHAGEARSHQRMLDQMTSHNSLKQFGSE